MKLGAKTKSNQYQPQRRRYIRLDPWTRRVFVALGVIWAISCLLLYGIAGARAVQETSAQNSARASSLRAAIANLPSFDTVNVGETSGTIPYVQYAREQLAKDIENDVYNGHAPHPVYILHPGYWTTLSGRNAHTSAVQNMGSELERTVEDTKKFEKFIAYSPKTDLGGNLDKSDADDRLGRTKQGLFDTRGSLIGSGLKSVNEVVKLLDPLIDQTPRLTDKELPAWSEGIQKAQKLVLSDIKNRDISQSDYAKQLESIAAVYQ